MDYTVVKNEFTISTDIAKLDIEYVHAFLSHSYWSPGIPIDVVKKAAENSLSFGIYHNNKGSQQIGYARAIQTKQPLHIWLMFLLMKITVAGAWENG